MAELQLHIKVQKIPLKMGHIKHSLTAQHIKYCNNIYNQSFHPHRIAIGQTLI